MSPPHTSNCSDHPWVHNNIMFGSGRDAFRALIEHGKKTRGWRRLHVPCYFCQEVVSSLLSTGIEVKLYPDGPEDTPPDLRTIGTVSGDVLLRVNFFGLRASLSAEVDGDYGIEVIDDHSHDPWSYNALNSNADWCVVSLRKTLPIPDGGVLWSPRGHKLPPQPAVTPEHQAASLEKLAAMALKSEYLEGQDVSKEAFRKLAVSSEDSIGRGAISGMSNWSLSILNSFPTLDWREQRWSNHRSFSKALSSLRWLKVMQVTDRINTCPFSAVIAFNDTELRNHIRRELISRNVYPTTLWPLDEPVISNIPSRYTDFSNRMLSIQCDGRYSANDMHTVANMIREIGCEYLYDTASVRGYV